MKIEEGNNIAKIYLSLIHRGRQQGKQRPTEKNKQICNNKRVNKLQQSKKKQNDKTFKTRPQGNKTNRPWKEIK